MALEGVAANYDSGNNSTPTTSKASVTPSKQTKNVEPSELHYSSLGEIMIAPSAQLGEVSRPSANCLRGQTWRHGCEARAPHSSRAKALSIPLTGLFTIDLDSDHFTHPSYGLESIGTIR